MSSAAGARDDTGKEILKAVKSLDATDRDIEQLIGGLVDEPNTRQKHLLEDLNRLVESLRGPEELLDRGSYNRPFPPRNKSYSR